MTDKCALHCFVSAIIHVRVAVTKVCVYIKSVCIFTSFMLCFFAMHDTAAIIFVQILRVMVHACIHTLNFIFAGLKEMLFKYNFSTATCNFMGSDQVLSARSTLLICSVQFLENKLGRSLDEQISKQRP